MTTRIKICGITRQEDAAAVVSAGADALGLNFAAASPRRVNLQQAALIARQVRGAVIRVGLFVDPEPDEVERVLAAVQLDLLQFHGDEPAALCASFGLPYMKVLRVREALDGAAWSAWQHDYAGACCLLLDAFVPHRHGGTGRQFDWTLWPARSARPLVLAGGLTPDNVADAVRRLSPWGVDVSGGVEGPTPGEKDTGRIARFVAEVKGAGS